MVKNEIKWYGYPEKDPSAVHIDVIHAEVNNVACIMLHFTEIIYDASGSILQIMGFNMALGIDGHLGKPMIREGQGFDVYVRRSLRDLFRKVPTLSLEVKVIFDFIYSTILCSSF